MNTNKLPNLGSTGWGKSLNDYIKGIETRVSDIEHGLNEITIEGISWDISSGVVGFNGRMMRVASVSDLNPDERVIRDGQEITSYRNPNQFFWKGEVFFKDVGNGTPVYKTIDDDGEAYWDIEAEPDTGWTPVYLKIEEFGEGLSYLKDSENAYLTHPFVILLGFIFYDGEKIYWYYKTSKSDESTYAKRFMLTRPLAKFNSTFDVKSNGGRSYTITGKQTGSNNPILTLNAMGINYYDSNLTDEFLKKGPDYKEFEISTDTPVISYISGSSAYYTNSTFTTPNTPNKRYIHRVFFSNVGRYVLQSEQYDSSKGTDFSTVVSYGFDNIYSNFERYGDLVEIFRFITEGTESSNNLIKVYQVIGSGIPPVDSFGVVPEVNYVSKEGSNNIQFTDSDNNYFTLVGQNYGEDATPKVIRFNFNNSDDNYNYHALMNYTDISTTNGILFKGGLTTSYTFSTTDLDLKMSNDRYIRMGTAGGFSDSIQLKNSDGSITINNSGIINLRHGNNKSLQLGSTGVQLTNGSGSLFLGDNGNIGLDNDNVSITMDNDISLDSTGNINLTSDSISLNSSNHLLLTSPSTGILSDRITLQNSLESTVIFENGELYGHYVGNAGENKWWLNSDHGYFSGLKVGSDSYKLVFLEDVNLKIPLNSEDLRWRLTDDLTRRYLLNLIPVLGQNVKDINFTYYRGGLVGNLSGYWTGTFPIKLYDYDDSSTRSITIARRTPQGQPYFAGLDSNNEFTPIEITSATIEGFVGWAWEVVPQGV